jgi:hypothetical protein
MIKNFKADCELDSWTGSNSMTPEVVIWVVLIAVLTFVASIAAVTVLLVRLPATYFLDSHDHGEWRKQHPILRWMGVIGKNLLGLVLIVVGVVMLFTPGQGVLTILIGIMLLDFPGKRVLERKLVARPSVHSALNRLRAKFGRPPLVLDEK